MNQMVLTIPEELMDALQIPVKEQVARLRQELAIRLYQKELMAFGKARELAKMSKWEFHDLLGQENIARHYDVAELEIDLETLDKRFKKI